MWCTVVEYNRVHVFTSCDTAAQVLPQWYKVLNVRTRGPCPELCLSLSIEEQREQSGSGSDKDTVIQDQLQPLG